MDEDLPPDGGITNGSSANNVKEEDEEANEQVISPSINSDLLMTLKTIFVDDFADKFNVDVVEKSYQQMKSIIGLNLINLNRQYNREQMFSIFEVLKIMLNNHLTDLMNEIVVSNASRIEAVLMKKIQTSGQNEQNSTIESEHVDEQVDIVSNGDAKETIAYISATTENETKNDEIFHMKIDVDGLMTDEDNVSNVADNDDHSEFSTTNVNLDEESKPKSDTYKVIRKCGDARILESSSIRIPDILKELDASSSNGEDNADNIENESTSNLHSDDKKSKNSTTNFEGEDEKDLFSLDVSAIPNIDNDNSNEEHSVDDDFFQNPFNNLFGLDDLDQICGTTITGRVDHDDDAMEDKDSEEIEKEKNNENEANNDPSESDKTNLHADNDDNENNQVDKFSKIDKLLKDARKLANSDDNDYDESNKTDKDDSKINKSHSNSNIDDSDDEKEYKISLNLRKRTKRLFSDEEVKKRKKSSDNSDSSKSSIYRPSKYKKRKRVVIDVSSDEHDKMGSDSVSDFDTPSTSRKKIKKIISPTRLNKETVNAAKAEKERRKRIEEKQKLYNQLVQENATKSSHVDEVILDFNKETKQALVEVDKAFVQHLKPHQVDGIKFLFDCTIETVVRLLNDNHAGGCILAHSMGLGKTFQVIAFLHTIMTNEHIKGKISKVLIIVPYNVIKNWANEFTKWFNQCGIQNEIPIHEMFGAKLSERANLMKQWHEKGGIMLIAIKLFSNLLNIKSKKNKDVTFKRCLIDPGPDMVIVDEGHLLKNDQGVFNRNVSKVKTLRRVILTGTPLQNNLSEYFTMVNFVKPQLLGTKKEFKNRFENPIRNGQHTDSTAYDVHLMKKRVHILHKLLKDCIHRCDYNVLVPYLQPKFEYVLSLRLTQTQIDMYKYFLENLVDRSNTTGGNLLYDYNILGLIWNHPALLHEYYLRKKYDEDEEDSMEDFINDDSSEESDSSGNDIKNKKAKTKTRSRIRVLDDNLRDDDDDSEVEFIFENKATKKKKINLKALDTQRFRRDENVIEEKRSTMGGWYEQFLPEEIYQVELSIKFKLLFTILEKSETIGDKILVFSQSLFNLNLIERFLKNKMDEYNDKYGIDKSYDELVEMTGGISHRWIQGLDYFRIDGNVNCQNRTSIVDIFNDSGNSRARLMLVSTKAGGIGINLVGANRCIIFDASWNPSNDMQAIFRIFRYGQTKPVYVYRFTAFGTMESKIYERQIIKQSLSHRVVDEQQIQRHFKASEISELYTFNAGTDVTPKLPNLPKDKLLADIFIQHKDAIISYHEHDSLLESRPEEELSEEERKLAWTEYETEKELPLTNPLLLNDMQFQGLGSSQIAQILAKRNNISNSIYQPRNLQPQNLNIVKQGQIQYQNEANMFLTKFKVANVIFIDKLKVCINLDTIINFGGKNLEYFENEFLKIFSEPENNNVENTTLTKSMFQYMEKCRQIAVGYQTKMKDLHPQASNELQALNSSLAKGVKSLEKINLEFIKKYNNFNFPTPQRQSKYLIPNAELVAGPSTLPKSAINYSRSITSQQPQSFESQESIECITLSDDDD